LASGPWLTCELSLDGCCAVIPRSRMRFAVVGGALVRHVAA